MFGKIGIPELILILGIALIIFGPRKLPEIGRSLGKGLREFRQATQEVSKEVTKSVSFNEEEDNQAVKAETVQENNPAENDIG